MAGTQRYAELDALRGLAALSVVIFHTAGLTAQSPATAEGWMLHTPVSFLWAGHEAVILFFILSGFVLSLPWIRDEDPPYGQFVVRRICRIWVPFAVALIIALAIRAVNNHGYPSAHLSAMQVLNFFGLVGYFDSKEFNGACWSLVHEMRISLIFPFVLAFIRCRQWRPVLAGAFLVSLVTGALRRITHPILDEDIWNTAHFLAFFIVGYLLARNLPALRLRSPLWLPIGICLYTYEWWFFPGLKTIHLPHINDWVITAGGAIIIVQALSGGGFSRILRLPLPAWLGRVSYSLYLYHTLVASALIAAFGWSTRIAIASGLASLAVAQIGRRWVELPAIGLGKRWAPSSYRAPMPAALPESLAAR
jgi:peptidoglycan/LPS O-acetylase OafA/YrhL